MLIFASANGTMRPWKNAYSIIGESMRHLLGRVLKSMARAGVALNSHRDGLATARARWMAVGSLTPFRGASTVLGAGRRCGGRRPREGGRSTMDDREPGQNVVGPERAS